MATKDEEELVVENTQIATLNTPIFTNRANHLVIGYLRNCKDIDIDLTGIGRIVTLYYLIKEYFKYHGTDCQKVSGALNEITTHGGPQVKNSTCYGSVLIKPDLPMIHKWKFKIAKSQHKCICIGIADPVCTQINFAFYACFDGKRYELNNGTTYSKPLYNYGWSTWRKWYQNNQSTDTQETYSEIS